MSKQRRFSLFLSPDLFSRLSCFLGNFSLLSNFQLPVTSHFLPFLPCFHLFFPPFLINRSRCSLTHISVPFALSPSLCGYSSCVGLLPVHTLLCYEAYGCGVFDSTTPSPGPSSTSLGHDHCKPSILLVWHLRWWAY